MGVGWRLSAFLPLLLVLLAGWSEAALAAPSVRVLDTYPAGQSVALHRNQSFYLRLAYDADRPTGIWIAPYFQGKQIAAGTSPSIRHTGKGEALAWFFFFDPGQQVDEIRIRAGDGGTAMPVVATYRVNIAGGSEVGPPPDSPWASHEPDWVRSLRDRERQAIRDEMASAPGGGPASAVLAGFAMLAFPAMILAGLAAPVWAMRRWEGGWRLAAAAPLVLDGFMALRIAVGVAADPTSHNLWPFELLMSGCVGLAFLVLLAILRALRGTAQRGGG